MKVSGPEAQIGGFSQHLGSGRPVSHELMSLG